jgi:hypothetical protein
MSLLPFTVDIKRDTATATAGGGETQVESTVYSGLLVTVNYPTSRSVDRLEGGRSVMGPGPLTMSQRVMILDPWDGRQVIRTNDRAVPNPAKAELPTAFKVVGVRPYEDMLQLDVEDISSPTAVT